MFNLPKVAPFLLLALQKLVFKCLDVRFHLVRLQDTHIVDPPLTLELPHLRVEELDIIIQIDGLVVRHQLRWWKCEPLFNTHNLVADFQVTGQIRIHIIGVHVIDQAIDEFDLCLKLVLGVVELQSLELAVVVDWLWQVVDEAHLHGFDVEFIVFTFADDYWLFVVLHVLIVVLRKLIFETHFVIIDNVMLVINLVVHIRIWLSFLLIPND